MDCQEAQRLLLEFVAGELEAKYKEDIEAHLGTCESCQKERYLLSKSWRMLGSYEVPKMPDNFTASLMRRIHSEQPQRFKARNIRPWVGAAAMGLVLLLVIYLFWKHSQETRIAQMPNSQSQQVSQGEPEQEDIPTAPQEAVVSNEKFPQPAGEVIPETDKAVIQDLDILQNADFLQHINMLKDYDVIVNPNVGNM
jgi:anti-sigma factor RsiW